MPFASQLRHLIHVWAILGGVLLLLIVLATAINAAGFTANMIARSWGGNVAGLSGYEDGVTLFVGVAAIAMFPYCQLHGGHAAVEIFMDRAPRWANLWVHRISTGAVAALALAMAYMLIFGTLEMRSDNTETAVLGWPVWIFMAFSVPSCLLWAVAALLQLFDDKDSPDGA